MSYDYQLENFAIQQGDLDNQGTALSVQEASQRFASVTISLLGHAGIRCPIEPVICPRVHVKLDRHSARLKRSA